MDILRFVFELFGQGARFEALSDQMTVLVVLAFYLVLAVLAFLWVLASLVFGEIGDLFDFLDFGGEGTFPAMGLGVLLFALGGALSLILGASPGWSVAWGLGLGAVAFLGALRGMRWLEANQTSTTLSSDRVAGAVGEWTLTVEEGPNIRRGLVVVHVGGMREELRARTDDLVVVGDRVRIIRADSARDVEVERLERNSDG